MTGSFSKKVLCSMELTKYEKLRLIPETFTEAVLKIVKVNNVEMCVTKGNFPGNKLADSYRGYKRITSTVCSACFPTHLCIVRGGTAVSKPECAVFQVFQAISYVERHV
jgi:hypothetical protein